MEIKIKQNDWDAVIAMLKGKLTLLIECVGKIKI